MGGLFRSEEMQYLELVLDEESSREVVRELGKFKLLHIEDHGRPEKALYKDNKRFILECLAWKKRCGGFRTMMLQNGVQEPGPEVQPDPAFKPSGNFLDAIQRYFEPIEKELHQQVKIVQAQTRDLNRVLEKMCVLKFSRDDMKGHSSLLDEDPDLTYGSTGTTEQDRKDPVEFKVPIGGYQQKKFGKTIYGTISTMYQSQFHRMIFRVSKGIAICTFAPIHQVDGPSVIVDPNTGQPTSKSMFCVMVLGEELPKRIAKICSVLGAQIFDVPPTRVEVTKELNICRRKREDLNAVLKKAKTNIETQLWQLSRNKLGQCPLVNWEKTLDEELAISEMLQRFHLLDDKESHERVGSLITTNCWTPKEDYHRLQGVLKNRSSSYMNQKVAKGMPPTYFKTNKFTGIFQGIVDTYGVANYQEANPGLFTIITFPFLFGIMYGDVFHGSILTISAAYMILNEKKFLRDQKLGKQGEIFGMAFGGRYLVIMMGIFAIFCGSIYNDCASIPMNVFGSTYETEPGSNIMKRISDTPYPWGLDPEWSHKANSLQFINSMKMKLAVIIGVIQMSFGIILGLTNDIHFKDGLSTVFEFIPRICFMLSTFGYMITMIIYKTFVDWEKEGKPAPNLIQTMIKMFLSPGSTPDPPLYSQPIQKNVQFALLMIALLSIPMMLFPKALIKYYRWTQKYQNAHFSASINDEHDEHDDHDHRSVGPHFSLSDDLITTGIHTIEFVLGCVSNTASYLRLWALSLAHAELSEVFWNKMIMQYGLNIKPLGFVGVAIWAVATTGVLLCMDVLECFLHALRLHWVEFQNKFYAGNGKMFTPFKLERD